VGSAYRPLIGIPSGSFESSAPGVRTFRFNENYTAAVAAAGGVPVAIPLHLPEDVLHA
jgi:gamma-glutamyl-gamma-aminobutyrate hydrolase PuuD